jgi:pimeloyl-ACP methyl ester carboxylesterase
MAVTTTTERSAGATAIRPFTIEIAEAELEPLRARVAATRWPDEETVADHSQRVQLATIQALGRYWATDYDWRRCEARLNALPQFLTEIDGLDIHFLHVRSQHEDALPLIVTHGWPGSVIEQLKIIDPLTNSTAYGASASDAFHLVIPSMPGYGFSGKPTTTGWDPARIAGAWVALMERLGYRRFVAQGGVWGGLITEIMAAQAPPELLGIHTNFPGTVPPEVERALGAGDPPPPGLTADERRAYEQLQAGSKQRGYAHGRVVGRQRGCRTRRGCRLGCVPVPGPRRQPRPCAAGHRGCRPLLRARRRAGAWQCPRPRHRRGGRRGRHRAPNVPTRPRPSGSRRTRLRDHVPRPRCARLCLHFRLTHMAQAIGHRARGTARRHARAAT